MPADKLRAGIIGCGRIGADCGRQEHGSSRIKSHAEAYESSEMVELVALCDEDEQRLDECGRRWNVDALYRSIQEFVAHAEVDLVSICTPSHTHARVLEELLDLPSVSGILVEKPLATESHDLQRALQLSGGRPTKIAVNYIRRYPPSYRKLVEDLQRGSIGRLQHVTAYYTKGIINNGTHVLDLLRLILGDPLLTKPLSICSDDEQDPGISFTVEFRGGVIAWVHNLSAKAHNIFEIDFIGSDGRVTLLDQGHLAQFFGIQNSAYSHGFRQLQVNPVSQETRLADSIGFVVDDLVSAVRNDRPPLCSVHDAAAALSLALEIRKQACG